MARAPPSLCSVSLWAWLLYFVGSLGYFLADGLSASYTDLTALQWNVLYTSLALLGFIDAVLYALEWFADAPRPLRIDEAAWATFINLLASGLYVLSSALYFFFPAVDAGGKLAQSHATVQAAINLLAVVLFLLDALMYNSWHYNTRPHTTRLFWWGELFNTMPSLGYTGTAVAQLSAALWMGADTPAKAHRDFLSLLAACNLAFDACFALDALVFGAAWYADMMRARRVALARQRHRSEERGDRSGLEFQSLLFDGSESGAESPVKEYRIN